MKLLIKGGTLVTEEGVIPGDLRITGELIGEMGQGLVPAPDENIIQAQGKIVLPGVIDAHTHYQMFARGTNTADDFFTGSLSAACGGVTTFVDYADPLPGRDLAESLQYRMAQAREKSTIDYHFHTVLHGGGRWHPEEMNTLAHQGVRNIKVFTTYEDMQFSFQELEELFLAAREQKMLVTVHAEDDNIINRSAASLREKGQEGPSFHGESRPAQAEIQAIRKIIHLAGRLAVPVYFVHVSTGKGASLIQEAQARGWKVYGETCPHYLLLTDQYLQGDGAQLYIMSPPLRTKADKEMLWQHLAFGTLQVVATDHCSYTPEQKFRSGTCFTTLPGIPGSETLLPLLYSEGVSKQRISLEQLSRYLSTNPARLFGLYPQKGILRKGSDADLVLLDPVEEWVLKGDTLHSAAGYTPYEGWKIRGRPMMTLLRGRIIFQQGEFFGRKGLGKFVPSLGPELI